MSSVAVTFSVTAGNGRKKEGIAVYIYCGSGGFCTAAKHSRLCFLLFPAPGPPSAITFSRLFIPEHTSSRSNKFLYIIENVIVFLSECQCRSAMGRVSCLTKNLDPRSSVPAAALVFPQQTCLNSTEAWRHKSNVRGLREWLLSIYESIRLHFLLKAKNHRQPLHAAVGFSSFH